MTDIKFIEKEGLCYATLADDLKKAEDKKEPIAIQQKVKDYALRFSKINKDVEAKLGQEIKALEIPLLTDTHMVEIINLMPKTLSELQTIFAGSKTTVSAENLNRLQEVIKAHEK